MRAIPEQIRGVITTRRYTNLRLPYFTLPSASVTWPDAKILAAQSAYKLHAYAPKLLNTLLQIWQWLLDTGNAENSNQMVLNSVPSANVHTFKGSPSHCLCISSLA